MKKQDWLTKEEEHFPHISAQVINYQADAAQQILDFIDLHLNTLLLHGRCC